MKISTPITNQSVPDSQEKLWENNPKSGSISSPEGSEQKQYMRDWQENRSSLKKSRPNLLDSD